MKVIHMTPYEVTVVMKPAELGAIGVPFKHPNYGGDAYFDAATPASIEKALTSALDQHQRAAQKVLAEWHPAKALESSLLRLKDFFEQGSKLAAMGIESSGGEAKQ